MSQKYVLDSKLCVSCGICAAVCPMKCIEMVYKDGQELPKIDGNKCIDCEKCKRVCGQYEKLLPTKQCLQEAECLECYSAWTQNEKELLGSTSGGVVTALVEYLLSSGNYEKAYLVPHIISANRLSAISYNKYDDLSSTRKSKYVPVSFEKAIQEILKEPTRNVILVATPCVVKNIVNVVEMFHLDRSKILLIGLFCDRTLNYNIIPYFEHFSLKKMSGLDFRNKEQGGWPGGVKLYFTDGSCKYLSRLVRAFAKEYFQLESCLYCLDKLNSMADISVGDDYTVRKTKKGRNSVIIRTEKGRIVFEKLRINKEACTICEILDSQGMRKRAEKEAFSECLYGKENLEEKNYFELARRKKKIEKGRKYVSSFSARTLIHFEIIKKRIIEKMRTIKKWIQRAEIKE